MYAKRSNKSKPWFLVLCAGLLASLVLVFGLLFLLDKSLAAKTSAKRDIAYKPVSPTQRGANTQVEALFHNSASTGSRTLNQNNINPTSARAALRNATAKSIQSAVQNKTGRTVSVTNIERARTKALSSDGQKKINEALKRRDEIDISAIREKLRNY